ncbi:MAG TPA: hypothetical protein VN903_17495, partial [Polyangia bacterium]|nr:hypothetical protein [Polyangia bacterium]
MTRASAIGMGLLVAGALLAGNGCGGSNGKGAGGRGGAGIGSGVAGTGGAAGAGTGGGAPGTGGATGTGGAAGTGGATGSAGAGAATGGGATGGAGAAGTTGGAGTGGATGGAGSGGATGGGGTGGTAACTFAVTSSVSTVIPTVGIVTFTTDLPAITGAEIRFGLASTGPTMSAPVDLALPDHRTLLLGMKPSSAYVFRIVATSAAGTCTSADTMLMTGPVPAGIARAVPTVIDAARHA